MKKYDYIIYRFAIDKEQEAQDWINRKGMQGYRVVNIHYYDFKSVSHVRFTLEKKLSS